MTSKIPQRADIVVIGGGVMGVSTAYHLAKLGRSDILLLEQGRLSCGTTWHAAGLVGQLRSSKNMTSMISYSAGLYSGLEAETGLATGWRQCGSVQVARTMERLEVLRRNVARAEEFGIEAELVSPERAGELWPRMTTDDLLGAVWVPSDGKVNPSDLTSSLAKGARRRGVTIAEQVTVTEVETRNGRAAAVITDQDRIECDTVVICAGQWSKSVGRMAGVSVPLHSAEHFYAVTEPIEGVHPDLPVLRDPDGYIYFKEEVGGLVMGGFEPQAKPWLGPYDLPDKFEFALLPEDLEQVAVLMESALHRVPAMAEVGIRKFYNGPESFTPDGSPSSEDRPRYPDVFVGAFNSAGIASAGGAGLALAEWIVDGRPTSDLRAADIRRFSRHDDNERFLCSRVMETLGMHYAMPWPNRQFDSPATPARRSSSSTACRRCVLLLDGGLGGSVLLRSPGQRAEVDLLLCASHGSTVPIGSSWQPRSQPALFDHSACAIFALKGPDSSDVLNWLCASEIHLVIGGSTRSLMLNEHGGCESEVFLVRLAEAST